MERTDITRLLGVLKAAWPDRPINEETVTAYEMAWSDLPFELGQGAVAEHLLSRTADERAEHETCHERQPPGAE